MPKQTNQAKKYTPEETADYRRKKQEEISALANRIDEGVKQVFESERFKDYLKFCSSFTNYSMGNTMLIAMQKPQATFVASFKKWQELGRNVDKGQKGIGILAPVQIKTGDMLVSEKEVTNDLGMKQYNDDGTVKTEKVEEPIKKLAFKQVYVFDVSQTSGKELPTLMDELNGELDSDHKKAILSGVQKAVNIPVEFENIRTGAKGYFDSQNQRIAINEGMSDFQTVKTAFHEAAHKFLHDKTQNLPTSKLSRNDREVQAEATAFIIASKYGIDTSEYSFPYIASWSQGKELNQLKSYLNEIQTAAREICKSIDSELIKLKAKRELTNDEVMESTELTNVQKAEIFIERKEESGLILPEPKKDEILKMASSDVDIKDIVSAVDSSVSKFSPDKALEEIIRHYGDYDYSLEELKNLPENDKQKIADLYNAKPYDEYGDDFEIDKTLQAEIFKSVSLQYFRKNVITDEISENFGIEIASADTRKAMEKEVNFADDTMSDKDFEYVFKECFNSVTLKNRDNEIATFFSFADLKKELSDPESKFVHTQNEQAVSQSYVSPKNDIPVPEDNVTDIPDEVPEYNNEPDYPPLNENDIPPEPDENTNYPQANLYEPDPPYEPDYGDYEPPEPPEQYSSHDYSVNEPPEVEPPKTVQQPESEKPKKQENDTKKSNIIGNVKYGQLGNKSDLKYFHATPEMTDKIAEKLNAEGIRFSGLKRPSGTTFTVNKADSERYANAVAELNAQKEVDLKKQSFKPKNPNVIGNCSYAELENGKKFGFAPKTADMLIKQIEAAGLKYAGYKKEDKTILAVSEKDVPKLQNAFAKVKEALNKSACRDFIAENINKAFENRAVKDFCKKLEEKFGIDTAVYVVGKNIAANKDKYPPQTVKDSRQFKYSKNDGIGLLENIQPTMIAALYNDLSLRKKELDREKEPPKSELNSYFNDKHLLPRDRKYLDKDENGFPITKHENTSANEFYVQGYGWLDNDAVEKARKESPNPALFGSLITKANVNYVDDSGRVGQADIDFTEYSVFSDITYSKENAERYEAAKQKLEERKAGVPVRENPTEYYAVSRISENRYNIVTMGTDGTPDIVKKGLTKSQAAKALEDIYYTKDSEHINCEIIRHSDLQEMCNKHYLEQVEAAKKREGDSYTEHDVSFTDTKLSVLPNPNKDAADNLSHFVQAYVKDGDRYKAASVAMVGTYDECRAFTDKAKSMEKLPEPKCEIYQLKGGEENRDYRFAGTKKLSCFGLRPDFRRYEKVYEAPVSALPKCDTLPEQLEKIYEKFNIDKPADFKGHSLSTSDVVVLDKKPFFVDSIGFKKMNNFLPEQTIEAKQREFLDSFEKRAASAKSPEELQALADEAKKLGIECEVELNKSLEQKKKTDKKPLQPQNNVKKGGYKI